jgi:phage FluMu gp28-like protein
MRLSERAQFLVDNLDLPTASGVDGARWEHFQLAHLSDDSPFRIEAKSRQIAWSFTVAAEAVADAMLGAQSTAIISINLDEASEKVRYARKVYECLQIGKLPRLIRDSVFHLEFSNGARIISHPATPPRGKARLNIVLDEFAHVQRDREIYTAAIPLISKGGRIRIGSSPFGASGVFWEIFREEMRKYPGYTRKTTPWWEIYSFCISVREARKLAPAMPTAERVEAFGNDRLKAIYANMLEEDFRQEYETEIVDEATAWISWEIIKRNQEAFADAEMWYRHVASTGEALALILEILDEIKQGKVEPALYGGIDVGRKKDLTEFFILGLTTSGSMPLRAMVSLDRVEFDEQEACFHQMITALPFVQVLVDQTGLGMQLAENLSRTGIAQGVTFTNETKALWATETKISAERGNTPIPPERDLSYQIHSIKKMITPAKNVVFDTARNEQHHADKFWAWALAVWAARSPKGVYFG